MVKPQEQAEPEEAQDPEQVVMVSERDLFGFPTEHVLTTAEIAWQWAVDGWHPYPPHVYR